jgi:hypothetical protein
MNEGYTDGNLKAERDAAIKERDAIIEVIERVEEPKVERKGRSVDDWLAQILQSLVMDHGNFRAAVKELREAAQNVAYCMARIGPPPYGHSCMWCGDCVKRAKDDLRAALEHTKEAN